MPTAHIVPLCAANIIIIMYMAFIVAIANCKKIMAK